MSDLGLTLEKTKRRSGIYHGDCEGVDAPDVLETELPGDETLYVDVQLVPYLKDGLIILFVPFGDRKVRDNMLTLR